MAVVARRPGSSRRLGAGAGRAGAQPAGVAFPADTKAQIDKTIAQWLTDSKAPGVVVGIWMPKKGTYVAARGYDDIANKTPMKVDDHFRIGSITKQFTVTAC